MEKQVLKLDETSVKNFKKSYVETLIFCQEMDDIICYHDLKQEVLEVIENPLDEVLEGMIETFGLDEVQRLLNITGDDISSYAGSDLLLTRNGEGSGFWDNPNVYGEDLSQRLTKFCEGIGSEEFIFYREDFQ